MIEYIEFLLRNCKKMDLEFLFAIGGREISDSNVIKSTMNINAVTLATILVLQVKTSSGFVANEGIHLITMLDLVDTRMHLSNLVLG